MLLGSEPVRALRRRLRVRRRVRFLKMPLGSWPERSTPRRRSTVTRFCSQITPAQRHGLVSVTFHRKVLPPTTERRAKSADRSKARSGFEKGNNIVRKVKTKMGSVWGFILGAQIRENPGCLYRTKKEKESQEMGLWVLEFLSVISRHWLVLSVISFVCGLKGECVWFSGFVLEIFGFVLIF